VQRVGGYVVQVEYRGMEEVYMEGAEGGLALYELLQFTVSVRLPR